IHIKTDSGVHGKPRVELYRVLGVGAEVVTPSIPERIVESGNFVDRDPKGKRLRRGQVGADWPGCRQSVTEIESHQGSLYRGRRQGKGANPAIVETKFGVEPQVVLDVVIGGPVRSAKLESMSASVPGHVFFELITFLMLLKRKKGRPAERGAAPRPYCAKA